MPLLPCQCIQRRNTLNTSVSDTVAIVRGCSLYGRSLGFHHSGRESFRIPSLFDAPAESRPVTPQAATGTAKVDEEEEILAEISEGEAESSASDELEGADAAP
jgi:hypothetical protein